MLALSLRSAPPLPAWAPAGAPAEAVLLAGGRRLVAAGDDALFRTRSAGEEWEVLPALPGRPLVTTLLPTARGLLTGTAGEGLWRLARGTWRRVPGPFDGRTVLTLAHRGDVLLAGTLRHGLFRSPDAGRSWDACRRGLPLLGHGLEVAQVLAAPGGWFALHPFGVSVSRDHGAAWRLAVAGLPPHRHPTQLAAVGAAVFAAVGDAVYRFDGVQGWTRAPGARSLRLVGAAAHALWTQRADGRLARSDDAGRTWTPHDGGLPGRPPLAVAATDGHVFALLDGFDLWRSPR